MFWKAKKLVVVSTNSTPMTKKKKDKKLEQVPYIWYLVTLKDQIKALLNSGSEVNIMSQAFSLKLGLKIWITNVMAQKIDGITLEIYGIVVSLFFMSNQNGKEKFFQKSFLLVNVKQDVVLEMLFLTMNNVDIDFQTRNLQ